MLASTLPHTATMNLLIVVHHRFDLWNVPAWFGERLRKEFPQLQVRAAEQLRECREPSARRGGHLYDLSAARTICPRAQAALATCTDRREIVKMTSAARTICPRAQAALDSRTHSGGPPTVVPRTDRKQRRTHEFTRSAR